MLFQLFIIYYLLFIIIIIIIIITLLYYYIIIIIITKKLKKNFLRFFSPAKGWRAEGLRGFFRDLSRFIYLKKTKKTPKKP
jgi:hypothetical protein